MMISIISVGKMKESYLKEAVAEYSKRLKAYTTMNYLELADEKAPEDLSEIEMKNILKKEGEKILSKISDAAFTVALEIEGEQLTSEAFAQFIENHRRKGTHELVFVIGGSLGLSDEVKKRADMALSFSKMTFPHQLMRVVLSEQIYRAFRIINGHPYHK